MMRTATAGACALFMFAGQFLFGGVCGATWASIHDLVVDCGCRCVQVPHNRASCFRVRAGRNCSKGNE
eukprot:1159330-Pelagomonas_calceolata.AAC.3